MHGRRVKRHGDPLKIEPTRAERFWSKVAITPSCWLWMATRGPLGYGQFHDGTRLVYAHRWAYEALVGPIPEGLVIDHLCTTPPCVNPVHLEPVTQAVNVQRTFERGNR